MHGCLQLPTTFPLSSDRATNGDASAGLVQKRGLLFQQLEYRLKSNKVALSSLPAHQRPRENVRGAARADADGSTQAADIGIMVVECQLIMGMAGMDGRNNAHNCSYKCARQGLGVNNCLRGWRAAP